MRQELQLTITIPDDEDQGYLSDNFIEALEDQLNYFKELKPIAFSGRRSYGEWMNRWEVRSVD